MKTRTLSGTLETFYETGMEHTGLMLYLDGPLYKTPNPKYDPNNHSNGPEFWKGYEGMIVFDKGDVLTITDCPTNRLMEGKSFTIGNREMAKSDKYRFGRNYPKEQIESLAWAQLFYPETTKAIITKQIKTVAFYGGSFDPIHNDHLLVVKELKYRFNEIVIIPSQNWMKPKSLFPIDQRINSVEAAFKDNYNVRVVDWSLTEDTSSTFEMYNKIKAEYEVDPVIIIGSDNTDNISQWKNWDQLATKSFIIFKRGGKDPVLEHFKSKPQVLPLWQQEDLSSSKIRATGDIKSIPLQALPFLDLELLYEKKK